MVIDIMYKKFGEERDAVFEYLYVSGQTNKLITHHTSRPSRGRSKN